MPRRRLLRRLLFALLVLSTCAGVARAQFAPEAGRAQFAAEGALQPRQLGIVINDDDPGSVEVGEYYRKRRNIPQANVVHVRIPGKPRTLSAPRFHELKDAIDAKLGPQVQAVLMLWTAPYAVECNSITGAYTTGLDPGLCARSCARTAPSPYFNSGSAQPYTDFKMRISMLLPTDSVALAKAVIDRGIASGFRVVPSTAYYLTTSETPRNSRVLFFPPNGRIEARKLATRRMQADALEGVSDIMIYETGMAQVDKLDTLKFRPGALADHLTSFGGDLLGDGQMSSLRWLEAGATASYGTVSEPCSFWQKFPNPSVLLQHYVQGNSAIEAYWKSVAWPTQGVFIGEPLAAPYHRR